MSGQNDVLLERLRLLNEYVSDLMAKFRNLIVHDYAGIDNRIVFEILKGRLRDFVDFGSAIAHYLESNPM